MKHQNSHEKPQTQSPQISARLIDDSPENPGTFAIVPDNSNRSTSEQPDCQLPAKKPHPRNFEEKISAEQRSTLIEWLAEHSYSEVQDLVAAEPPVGFGLSVGKTTLCRFYKAHFVEIDGIRQLRLDARAYSMTRISEGGDYADTLNNSSRQLLLERYFEMLSRPLETIDELKKLAAIGEKIHALHAEEKRTAKIAQLFGGFPPALGSQSNRSHALHPPGPISPETPHENGLTP